MRSPLSDRSLLVLLLLLNALLKFSWLGVNDLSGDEPFTVYWSQQRWPEIFAMLRTENNPPLHFLLVKVWSAVVPLQEGWLRVPFALFSVITVWPLFLLARALGDRWTAVLTGLLFTLNNHQYVYAHEVRGYSLLLLLTVIAMCLVVRVGTGDEPSSTGSRVWLSLVFIGLVYTHFFGWLVIGLLGVCSFVLPELRSARRLFIIAASVAVLAALPYGLVLLHRASTTVTHGTWVKPHGAEEIWHMVRRWSNQPVVALLLLVPIVIVTTRERARSLILRFGLWWMLVPLLGLWLLQRVVPVYVDRYLLFASPGFYLLAGYAGVQVVRATRWRWVLPASGAIAMAVTFTPWKDNGQHPSRVAAQVRAWQHTPQDPPVLVQPFWYKLTLQMYMDRSQLADPPWNDVWSDRYNDRGSPNSTADPRVRTIVLVRMAAPEDGAGVPYLEGFRLEQEVQADDLIRVGRYVR